MTVIFVIIQNIIVIFWHIKRKITYAWNIFVKKGRALARSAFVALGGAVLNREGVASGSATTKLKNLNSTFYFALLILIFQFGPYFTPYALAKLPTFNPTAK